jgi:hypothetical protein
MSRVLQISILDFLVLKQLIRFIALPLQTITNPLTLPLLTSAICVTNIVKHAQTSMTTLVLPALTITINGKMEQDAIITALRANILRVGKEAST